MTNTIILKEEQFHHNVRCFEYTHAPQFLLQLYTSYQNNVVLFSHNKYTLTGNVHRPVIMIAVKDFRPTLEKPPEKDPEPNLTARSNGSRGVAAVRNPIGLINILVNP